MITINPSQTADTRTCDFANTSKATLLASSAQHIGDVGQALALFGTLITAAAVRHDTDKLTDIDGFHADFVTGFAQTGWWDRHRTLNRHHLQQADGIPADVNLIDVLDFIADCVMAGMARSGSVYPLSLPPELLERAFQNTVALLKSNVVVAPVGEPAVEDYPGTTQIEPGVYVLDPVGEPAPMTTGEHWKCPMCADAWMRVTKPAKYPPICSCGGEMQKQSPAHMPPEIQVGDIVTDRLLGVVTVRELDGIGGVIVVWTGGMEAVVPVDDILSIYRDPLWRRTDRKEP